MFLEYGRKPQYSGGGELRSDTGTSQIMRHTRPIQREKKKRQSCMCLKMIHAHDADRGKPMREENEARDTHMKSRWGTYITCHVKDSKYIDMTNLQI